MNALIVVDVQNDFLPRGALGVQHGDQIIPIINTLRKQFPLVVFSQDWHPLGHKSFATEHPGKKVGDLIMLDGLNQVLWPIHCVQNTAGAAFASSLDINAQDPVFRKGTDPNIDSYSTFYDNGHKKSTGLTNFLKQMQADTLYFSGLATDYCVKFSVLDAIEDGFKVSVIRDACRAVNLLPNDEENALEVMAAKGAKILTNQQIRMLLGNSTEIP